MGHFCVICPEGGGGGVISVLFPLKGGHFCVDFSPARGSPLCEGGAQLCNCSVHLFQLECYLADCVLYLIGGGGGGGRNQKKPDLPVGARVKSVCVCVCACECINAHILTSTMQNKPTSKHIISRTHTLVY